MYISKLEVGCMLKEEKEKKKYTYDEIAKGSGISSSFVYRIGTGSRKNPSYDHVIRMIKFFDLTEKELLNYQENVADIDLRKANLINDIASLNVNDFEAISKFLKDIKEYQETLEIVDK